MPSASEGFSTTTTTIIRIRVTVTTTTRVTETTTKAQTKKNPKARKKNFNPRQADGKQFEQTSVEVNPEKILKK